MTFTNKYGKRLDPHSGLTFFVLMGKAVTKE